MPSSKTPSKVVVSGIQPTGRLHIGNYIGAIRNWLQLQNDPQYRCYFFVADWHSMTIDYDPRAKRQQVLDLAADLLALGLDPDKVTLFVQSDVMEHAELTWIFNTLTPISLLERMTQFKDKAKRHQENVNMGLFDYPVLQAADILIYKGQLVPVGTDQVQHVELTRDIAGFFNNRFGQFFPETKPLLTEVPKVRSLTEPTRKMSKSHGDKSCLYLTDSFDDMYDKVKRVPTEATGIISMDEMRVEEAIAALGDQEPDEKLKGMAGVWNLLQIIRQFGSEDEMDRLVAAQPLKYGELKKLAATRVAEHFAKFQRARQKLVAQPKKIEAVLASGAKQARSVAKKTMAEVRKLTGLR